VSIEKITQVLKAWQNAMRECDERMDQLAELTGQIVESPLGDAVYGLMGAYTKQVAEQVGWCFDTLESWWCENHFGEQTMRIGFAGEELRTITTIEALAEFIAEDLARAES
jgi:hypothetical protein